MGATLTDFSLHCLGFGAAGGFRGGRRQPEFYATGRFFLILRILLAQRFGHRLRFDGLGKRSANRRSQSAGVAWEGRRTARCWSVACSCVRLSDRGILPDRRSRSGGAGTGTVGPGHGRHVSAIGSARFPEM